MKSLVFSEPYSPLSASFGLHTFLLSPILISYFLKISNYLQCAMWLRDEPRVLEAHCHLTDSIVFGAFVATSIALQMMIVVINRPSALIFDFRFIPTAVVQFTGFSGCVGMACALESIFPIPTPPESSDRTLVNKPTRVPWSKMWSTVDCHALESIIIVKITSRRKWILWGYASFLIWLFVSPSETRHSTTFSRRYR